MARALVASLLALFAAGCAAGPPEPALSSADASGERILVMIADPDIGRFDLRGARSGPYRLARGYPGRSARVSRVLDQLEAEYRLQAVEGWPMRSLGVYCEVFEVASSSRVDELIGALSGDARVESVQSMFEFETQASTQPEPLEDPYRPLQHALEALELAAAHRWASGRGVRVAIIDTGVDANHPELVGQIVESQDFSLDRRSAGGRRHGTAVAGVIGSRAGNRTGIVGVAPGARLLALRACHQVETDAPGRCTSFTLARAIDHAIVAGANVLNLSFAGPHDRLLERLLAQAIDRGRVVVAAQADGAVSFPASMQGVIAVADDAAADGLHGLRAPGRDVLTLVSPDGYDFFSGSSLAAAHVTGVVALLLERAPRLRAAEVAELLARTARQIERDGSVIGMMVSACGALAELAGESACGGAGTLAQAGSGDPSVPSD